MKEFYIAPVQGHTDAAWRHFHQKIYGGDHKYFTPFIRLEHEKMRRKDLKDLENALNEGINLEPQVIFSNVEELDILLNALAEANIKSVNLNMGCPFPPQTVKGRGAGFIKNVSEARKVALLIEKYSDLKFSVKMRLGLEQPDEWKDLIFILNSIELDNIYIHPRIGRQQYKGELYLDSFAELLEGSKNPVVFNGDIKKPEDIENILSAFPQVNGIMVARGILGRPSLASEFKEGEWSREDRIEKMMLFHRELFKYYRANLCGDSQILSKIKCFWEYAEVEIGRKAWKAIKKATDITKYNTAVTLIEL